MNRDHILKVTAEYYGEKVRLHGPTPRGVDWNSESSQVLRFEQLSEAILDSGAFSLLDYGCGYGALFNYLSQRFGGFEYWGFDVSPTMIETAADILRDCGGCSFLSDASRLPVVDYVLASGIFNVKLDICAQSWEDHLFVTLDEMNRLSRRGFGFNCLTMHCDADKMRADLYYADPSLLAAYCLKRFSRRVVLRHDYALHEFTIIVRKQD